MAEWVESEKFYESEYGRLSKEHGPIHDYRMVFKPEDVPPGGRVVYDPKDQNFGIIVDAEGTAICRVAMNPIRREQR